MKEYFSIKGVQNSSNSDLESHVRSGFRELTKAEQRKRVEEGNKAVDAEVAALAVRVNARTEPNFVKEDGSVGSKSYRGLPHPDDIYTKEEIEKDKKTIQKLNENRAMVDDQGTRDLFRKNNPQLSAGKNEEDIKRLLLQQQERMKKESNKTEILATLLLDKVLGDRYTIVRTNEYDDNFAGVDTLIVDRVTGEVIGAFDEVHNDDLSKAASGKDSKILGLAHKNGATIKYGFTYVNGKLVKKQLENIPVFYLALNTTECKAIIDSLLDNKPGTISAAEVKIFNGLVASLKGQIDKLLSAPLKNPIRAKIEQAGRSISTWKA